MTSTSTADELHHTHVAAGYKAALTNPRISEAAKEHARQQLEVLEGYDDEQKNEHNNRVLGGFKAALHNPNTSEDAKRHAREVLEAAGVDVGDEPSTEESAPSAKPHDQHTARVLAGYKATLHNPKTSEEAKAHAREVLESSM
ncbi:hypothetical protein JB92DRAFT_2914777 [Gautieria morchelliformis]|nr:hypothetical protein JB92DRAFT_2914777 [Gautieria morchelliformis]